MPVYTNPQTGKRYRSATPLNPDQLEELFGSGAPADDSTWYERAGGYLKERAQDVGGAFGRILKHTLTPPPLRTEEPTYGQAAADIATVGGTALGWPYAAGSAVAGAGARALGASPETAKWVDIVTSVAGGIGHGLYQGGKALGAARRAPEALKAYEAEAAAGAPRVGRELQGAVPGIRRAWSLRRAAEFDPIIKQADALGLRLSPEATARLQQGLLDASDEAVGTGKRLITETWDEIAKGGQPTMRQIDDALRRFNQAGGGGKTAAARRALGRALEDVTQGTPLQGKMTQAGRFYNIVLLQGRRFADKIAGAGNNQEAAQRAVRFWRGMPDDIRQIVDPTGEVADMIRRVTDPAGRLAGLTAQAGQMKPAGGLIGGLSAGAGVASGVGYAYHRARNGDFVGAFEGLLFGGLAGAGRYPGVARAMGKAAAPPVARGLGAGGARLVPQPAPARTPERTPGPQARARGWDREIAVVSRVVGVPAPLVRAVMHTESRGNPWAVGGAGERGAMQVMPRTFASLKPWVERLTGRPASFHDPLDTFVAGVLYLRKGLAATGGHPGLTARYYNGGPGGVHRPRPSTLDYEQKVLRQLRGA